MTCIICAVLRPESVRAVALAGDLAELLAFPLVLVDIRPPAPDAVPASGAGDPMALGLLPPAPPPADLEAPPAAAIASLSAKRDVSLIVAADAGGGPLAAAFTGATAVAGGLALRLGATLTFVHAGDEPETADRIAYLVRSRLPDGQEATLEVLPRADAGPPHLGGRSRRRSPGHRTATSRRIVSALMGSVVHGAARHGRVPIVIAPDGAGAR